jgi:iron(III) transport system substrate-binding protein
MVQRTRIVALLAAAAVALVGCGSSPTSDDDAAKKGSSNSADKAMKVYNKLNSLTGDERKKELVKMAEAEGELSIYTSNTDMDALIDAFEDLYDVDVSVYRANSETVLQRVLQESKAKFYGNDVFETNALELDIANQEGLLAPYQSELRDQVRPEADADNWVGTRMNVFVVSYNTDKVKPSELPETIEGFADPKWKGRLSMEIEDIDWFAAMHGYFVDHGMTDDEATDLFKRIAANAKIVKGHTVQAELLSAGQFDIGISTYSHSVDELTNDGAPVAWRVRGGNPVQPLVTRPNGIGLMRTAEHPAAATLFADFELEEGQQVFRDEYRIGAIPTGEDLLAGMETVPVQTDDLLAQNEKWSKLYEAVVQGGEVVETED